MKLLQWLYQPQMTVVWRETCYCMPFSWKVVYLCKHYPLWTSVTEFFQWCLVKILYSYYSVIAQFFIYFYSTGWYSLWSPGLLRGWYCVFCGCLNIEWFCVFCGHPDSESDSVCSAVTPTQSLREILCVLWSPRLGVWEWFCVFCGHPDSESESDSVCSVVTTTQSLRVILCVLWSPRLRVRQWFCVFCGNLHIQRAILRVHVIEHLFMGLVIAVQCVERSTEFIMQYYALLWLVWSAVSVSFHLVWERERQREIYVFSDLSSRSFLFSKPMVTTHTGKSWVWKKKKRYAIGSTSWFTETLYNSTWSGVQQFCLWWKQY